MADALKPPSIFDNWSVRIVGVFVISLISITLIIIYGARMYKVCFLEPKKERGFNKKLTPNIVILPVNVRSISKEAMAST